jgi:outer membrane protein W/outer membrane protein OmpA-like peptidoglycan-associated protein
MSSRYLIPLAVAAALAAPIAANAWDLDAYPGQPKGDWIFRLGWTDVNPQDRNVRVSNDPNAWLVADQGTSLSGTITYMITDNIGTELLLAYPFTHGIDVKGQLQGGGGRIGYVDQLPPTLSLQWHFNPDGVIRPYIGVGLNYTMYSSESLKQGNVNSLLGTSGYKYKLSMNDSFGAAGQVGVDWRLSEHWLLNTEIRYIGISSKGKVSYNDGEGGTGKLNLGSVDINPLVYTVGFGYRWGAPAKPVAAPPPPPPPVAPPPPPPPAKCSDTDNDGVCDADDKCPDTPAGTTVDKVGCPCKQELMVNFAFDSAELTPESINELERVVKFMNDVPDSLAEIDGYTDSVGTDAYNLKLSDRRAKAVFDYVTSRGVNPDRLKSHGYGEADPIAPNDTAEGRAKNRRVMLIRTDSCP